MTPVNLGFPAGSDVVLSDALKADPLACKHGVRHRPDARNLVGDLAFCECCRNWFGTFEPDADRCPECEGAPSSRRS